LLRERDNLLALCCNYSRNLLKNFFHDAGDVTVYYQGNGSFSIRTDADMKYTREHVQIIDSVVTLTQGTQFLPKIDAHCWTFGMQIVATMDGIIEALPKSTDNPQTTNWVKWRINRKDKLLEIYGQRNSFYLETNDQHSLTEKMRDFRNEEKKAEEEGRTLDISEIPFGGFQRLIVLPPFIEERVVSWKFQNGLLFLHLPAFEDD